MMNLKFWPAGSAPGGGFLELAELVSPNAVTRGRHKCMHKSANERG